jgi:hypothetical protein
MFQTGESQNFDKVCLENVEIASLITRQLSSPVKWTFPATIILSHIMQPKEDFSDQKNKPCESLPCLVALGPGRAARI